MSEFKREDRYFVFKMSDFAKLSREQKLPLLQEMAMISPLLPKRECLVIESDWPEYESAWQMIERRMTGQPEVSAAEELDAVLHWRGKHAVAIKERDALQQRLTASVERADVLEGLLREAMPVLDRAASAFKSAMPLRSKVRAALKLADTAKCERCGCSTVETCDERGCGYLGAGNGAPE